MATLTLLARPSTAIGGLQGAVDADVLIGSNFQSHASTALTLNAAATNLLLKVAGSTVLTVAAAGVTCAQPLAMSSQKITDLATATTTGDALGYPWITSAAAIQILGSTYTISADNGAYEDTGLSVTLPSAGTYLVWYTARTNISAAVTAGAYILVELYNSTDAVALANTEEIGAYAAVVGTSYYGVPHLLTSVTVAASKVIKLYAKAVAPTSTTIRTINSDTNGRTNLGYVKITP